jgi:hypothetical protein
MAYPSEVWKAIREKYEAGTLTTSQLGAVPGNPTQRAIDLKVISEKWKDPPCSSQISKISKISEKKRLTKQEA